MKDELSRDTSGENNYHHTSSFDDDLLLDLDARGTAQTRLDRTQDDLNKFRQRIDNNVEQQKEYSEMMAALQNKVHEYRKHIADLEGKMVGARRRYLEDPSSFTILDTNLYHDTNTNTYIRDMDMWNMGRGITGGGTNIVLAGGDSNANYEIMARLDEERRRGEEYRMQWENEHTAKERLEDENDRLRREFDLYDRECREKERVFVNRERVFRNVHNITRNINVVPGEGLQSIAAGGTGAQSIAALLTDLLTSTGGSISTNNESTLIEAVKRYRDRSGEANVHRSLLEELRQIRGNGPSEADAELHKELMKKYEESIERNIELESKGDECQRKIADLEAELRRTREKLSDSTNALRKLYEMSQDVDLSLEGTQKRTRSLSPGKSPLSPTEAVRAVRNTIRIKDNEMQQLLRKLKIAESQAKFMGKFETVDDVRRRLDKQLSDSKREIGNQEKHIDELERNLRRLEDKLRSTETEKLASDKARKFLEDELAKLQASYQKATSDDARKIRDELDDHASSLEEEYKNRQITRERDI
uniref:t-SNARE coiled-coil homology domain-containing protein n=1 Tax=Heterorhabditis bacteriophora TaxID=37862 RepID=A0A1I7XQW4_HETBA